jgi:chemotaxis protein MotB
MGAAENHSQQREDDGVVKIESIPESHEEGWLVSYADLMTLLFGFFVIMFSISAVDKAKLEELKKMAAEQFSKVEYKNPTAALSGEIQTIIDGFGEMRGDIEITEYPDGVKVALRGRSFFASGSSVLSSDGQRFVDKIAENLRNDSKKYSSISIEGHSDNVPIETLQFPSNWELSASRAAAVVRALVDKGIPSARLSASGYADSKPLVPNVDSSGMPIYQNQSKNRRIEVMIKIPVDEVKPVSK